MSSSVDFIYVRCQKCGGNRRRIDIANIPIGSSSKPGLFPDDASSVCEDCQDRRPTLSPPHLDLLDESSRLRLIQWFKRQDSKSLVTYTDLCNVRLCYIIDSDSWSATRCFLEWIGAKIKNSELCNEKVAIVSDSSDDISLDSKELAESFAASKTPEYSSEEAFIEYLQEKGYVERITEVLDAPSPHDDTNMLWVDCTH